LPTPTGTSSIPQRVRGQTQIRKITMKNTSPARPLRLLVALLVVRQPKF